MGFTNQAENHGTATSSTNRHAPYHAERPVSVAAIYWFLINRLTKLPEWAANLPYPDLQRVSLMHAKSGVSNPDIECGSMLLLESILRYLIN